jgi:hypothetical protein
VKILTVSSKDADHYRRELGATDIETLPIFLPFREIAGKEGTGCFCLYHGNLSVPENEQMVLWLLKKVFGQIELPFIISGKNPSPRLQRLAAQYPQACLIPNPSEEEMHDLIAKAQVHILPSFNCTGVKLKLLNALYNGRHCIVNRDAVDGTGLERLCHIATGADDVRCFVSELFGRPFRREDIEMRKKVLEGIYDPKDNVDKLMKACFSPA